MAVIHHHFTVDVEEYFQVSAFERHVERGRWDEFESRVEKGVDLLLELLDAHDARATFFTLGWVAERHPGMLKRIAGASHEIASHGWGHRRVTTLSPDDFRDSVRNTKRLIEDIVGESVIGYRAPSFSIVPGLEWALDVLIEEGYSYDSSLFPVRRRGYGYPGGNRDPHVLHRAAGRLAEVPPSTLSVAGLNLPAAGGGYLRLLPLGLVRAALRSAAKRGAPGTVYIHPWELDPDQPRIPVSLPTQVRHYTGLGKTVPRLQRLLQQFTFRSVAEGLENGHATQERVGAKADDSASR